MLDFLFDGFMFVVERYLSSPIDRLRLWLWPVRPMCPSCDMSLTLLGPHVATRRLVYWCSTCRECR